MVPKRKMTKKFQSQISSKKKKMGELLSLTSTRRTKRLKTNTKIRPLAFEKSDSSETESENISCEPLNKMIQSSQHSIHSVSDDAVSCSATPTLTDSQSVQDFSENCHQKDVVDDIAASHSIFEHTDNPKSIPDGLTSGSQSPILQKSTKSQEVIDNDTSSFGGITPPHERILEFSTFSPEISLMDIRLKNCQMWCLPEPYHFDPVLESKAFQQLLSIQNRKFIQDNGSSKFFNKNATKNHTFLKSKTKRTKNFKSSNPYTLRRKRKNSQSPLEKSMTKNNDSERTFNSDSDDFDEQFLKYNPIAKPTSMPERTNKHEQQTIESSLSSDEDFITIKSDIQNIPPDDDLLFRKKSFCSKAHVSSDFEAGTSISFTKPKFNRSDINLTANSPKQITNFSSQSNETPVSNNFVTMDNSVGVVKANNCFLQTQAYESKSGLNDEDLKIDIRLYNNNISGNVVSPKSETEGIPCPMCYATFPNSEIENHAYTCDGVTESNAQTENINTQGSSQETQCIVERCIKENESTEESKLAMEMKMRNAISETESDDSLENTSGKTSTGPQEENADKCLQCPVCSKMIIKEQYCKHVTRCVNSLERTDDHTNTTNKRIRTRLYANESFSDSTGGHPDQN